MKRLRKWAGLILLVSLLVAGFYGMKIFEDRQLENSTKKELINHNHANPDVYAWLKVDGTNIDYPIAQHPDDDSYYLTHDLEHQATYYGAIFTEKINTKSFDDFVTIIYGHAIQDGSMFGSLENFSEQSIFERYKTIEIETVDDKFSYDIIAAYQMDDSHLFHSYKLGDKDRVKEYVLSLESQARLQGGFYRFRPFDVEKDKLLILSTCDSQTDTKRYILHAVRRNE